MQIEYITSPSGDYYILKRNGRVFSEGHSISAGTFLDLLENHLGVDVKYTEISDQDMEEGNY